MSASFLILPSPFASDCPCLSPPSRDVAMSRFPIYFPMYYLIVLKDKLRAAAGGAQKLDNVILRVLAEVTERTARRERLAALAEAIRLFALKEANRWDQQSDTEKTLGVLLVRPIIIIKYHLVLP